jgi:hypothetical protein
MKPVVCRCPTHSVQHPHVGVLYTITVCSAEIAGASIKNMMGIITRAAIARVNT